MTDTSQRNRSIMSGIAIVIGVVMMAVIPFLVQTSLERVLVNLMEHVKTHPAFSSGLKLFDFFYPVWRALIFTAGATLIVTSQQVRKGETWAYSLAMVCFALPAIGGMFMFLPYVSWVPGFPLPIVISMIGLAGFWSFILLRAGSRMEKLARLGALTFIGMLGTHAFTVGVGAQRTMWTRPGYPLYEGFEWWLFNWAGEVNWVSFILLFASIPMLAIGIRRGWWLAVIAAVTILSINIPTQFFRTKTLDWLYGSLLAAGVLIFTVVPYFKRHLLAEPLTEEEEVAGPETGMPAAV
ncbi:MAG: hypothetical protein RRC07_06450 [Anaerolineae bacterium]|nr:hypothetical protein [Anaerolineae bacterium]